MLGGMRVASDDGGDDDDDDDDDGDDDDVMTDGTLLASDVPERQAGRHQNGWREKVNPHPHPYVPNDCIRESVSESDFIIPSSNSSDVGGPSGPISSVDAPATKPAGDPLNEGERAEWFSPSSAVELCWLSRRWERASMSSILLRTCGGVELGWGEGEGRPGSRPRWFERMR